MKKRSVGLLFAFLMVAGASHVNAQKSSTGSSYNNAIGLGIDFGDGITLVGPSFKHFFTENTVGSAEVLFGDDLVGIFAYYQYHKDIDGADGLKWFAGGGPGFLISDDNSAFALRPMAGLDYKIGGAPISLSFDWRPLLGFYSGDTDFEPARFGLGFRFTFD